MATLIASAVALHHVLENLPPKDLNVIPETRIENIADLDYGSLLFNSRAAAGTGIAISLLTIIYAVVPIVIRFLNIGLVNYKIKIFLSIVSKYSYGTWLERQCLINRHLLDLPAL